MSRDAKAQAKAAKAKGKDGKAKAISHTEVPSAARSFNADAGKCASVA